MELEGIAREGYKNPLPFTISEGPVLRLDLSPAVRSLAEKRMNGDPVGALAFSFHETLMAAFRAMAVAIRTKTGLNRVALSGGCFQNRILLQGSIRELKDAGFDLFHHHLVPTNDGGISLGQAFCAASRALAGDSPRLVRPFSLSPNEDLFLRSFNPS
jgi:hydrogenase maturation protein HypF